MKQRKNYLQQIQSEIKTQANQGIYPTKERPVDMTQENPRRPIYKQLYFLGSNICYVHLSLLTIHKDILYEYKNQTHQGRQQSLDQECLIDLKKSL